MDFCGCRLWSPDFHKKDPLQSESCSENFCFSARQGEAWGLIGSCLHLCSWARQVFFSLVPCRPLLIRYNFLETEDYSHEFCCVQPTSSPEPPKLSFPGHSEQGPPAVVVMPVVKTLVFQALFANVIC